MKIIQDKYIYLRMNIVKKMCTKPHKHFHSHAGHTFLTMHETQSHKTQRRKFLFSYLVMKV